MRKPLIVIKLGGAAVTDKKKIYTPRIAVIKSAANQIARLQKNFSLIIVHGAGSFGHIPAKKFELTNGFTSPRQIAGLSLTKSKLLEWELILTQVFHQHRVPTISILASDLIVTRRGRIKKCDLEQFRRWLKLGCIPMTGGDIVPDELNGFAIMSGDQIAVHLAVKLKASKLIFGTDVDGIFSSNPKEKPTAKLFSRVSLNLAERAVRASEDVTDVTGGMGGKLNETVNAVRHGVPVFFVNVMELGRLLEVANNRKTVCTEIVP